MAALSICMLGGTGFVGSRLAARLAGMGHQLRILTRYREAHRRLLVLPTVRLIEADVHQRQHLATNFRDVDVVINLVGILNERGRDGREFHTVHVELLENILAAAEQTGVRRLLQMSALNADAESGPSHYLRSRGEAEQRLHAHRGSVDWTVFRPSVIFGPGDSFINRFLGLMRIAPVLPLARPQARFAPVYVGDVVEAFVLGLAASRGQTYELCGPEVLELKTIVEFLAREAGLKRALIGLPDALGRLQARVFDFVPGKPFSTDNFLSLTVDSVCRQNGFAALGLTPHSFTATVPMLIRGDRGSRLRRWRQRYT